MKKLISLALTTLLFSGAALSQCNSISPARSNGRDAGVQVNTVQTCENNGSITTTITYTNGTVKIINPDHSVQEIRVNNEIKLIQPDGKAVILQQGQ